MRTADVFHAPAVPYNTPIRGRLSTPFTVLFSETRNTLPARMGDGDAGKQSTANKGGGAPYGRFYVPMIAVY